MKKICLFVMGLLGTTIVFGAEGDTGTVAYQWANYKALDSVTYPTGVSLSMFQGKVILMNVFQYNCGGCDANAPTIGRIADSIGSGKTGVPFQAVGTEIDNGTFAQIQASYNTQLKKNAPTVNYPLVHVPFDTAITTDAIGTKWHRYNSYRDVYFVIGYNGKIVGRVSGNRANAMAADSLTKLKNALTAALAAVPAGILCVNSCGDNGLKTYRQSGGFRFSATHGPVLVQILDLQGRMMRVFSIPPGSEAIWNGVGATGNAVPFGAYFLKATGPGFSASQRINWLP